MASKSVQAISADKLSDLAIHDYAMDGETAIALHQVDGILELIREALDGVSIGEPMPAGVQCSVWAAHNILCQTMARGGIKETRP